MIIEVNHQYNYNAPKDIKLGNKVRLPRGQGYYGPDASWVGTVTGVDTRVGSFSGPIKAILGKVEPITKTFVADTQAELVGKVRAWLITQEGLDRARTAQNQQYGMASHYGY